jgi:xanthine/uracil permease
MKLWPKIKKHFGWKTLIGVVIGGTGGYLYYYFVGCNSGSCPITSNPWASIFWGSLIGMIWTVK